MCCSVLIVKGGSLCLLRDVGIDIDCGLKTAKCQVASVCHVCMLPDRRHKVDLSLCRSFSLKLFLSNLNTLTFLQAFGKKVVTLSKILDFRIMSECIMEKMAISSFLNNTF